MALSLAGSPLWARRRRRGGWRSPGSVRRDDRQNRRSRAFRSGRPARGVNRYFRTSRPTKFLNLEQSPASWKRPASSQQPAAAAPEDDREARFEGLPKVFIPNANAVGPRPHPEALRALILDICRHRDWTTPAELARWFDMHRRSLSNRYLRPLLEAGLLERRFSDSPNTPNRRTAPGAKTQRGPKPARAGSRFWRNDSWAAARRSTKIHSGGGAIATAGPDSVLLNIRRSLHRYNSDTSGGATHGKNVPLCSEAP